MRSLGSQSLVLSWCFLPLNCFSCVFSLERDGPIHAVQLQLNIYHPGEAVTVEDEVVVVNSIVLPNKTLNVSVQQEIIL